MFVSSLGENPVENGLNHHNKNDEEDEVAVDVAVAVPLLLLVQTHLQRVIQFSYSFTHYSLLLNQRFESLLQAGGGVGGGGWLSTVFLIRVAGVTVLRSLLLVFNFPSCFMSARYAGNTLMWRLE